MSEHTFTAGGHTYRFRLTFSAAADAEMDMPRSLLEIAVGFLDGHSRLTLGEIRAFLYHGCKGEPGLETLESTGRFLDEHFPAVRDDLIAAIIAACGELMVTVPKGNAEEEGEAGAAVPGKPGSISMSPLTVSSTGATALEKPAA